MAPTPKQQLASVLLGENLDSYVATRRSTGRTWRLIARDIYEATNGQVDISHESLRGWYPDAQKASA